MNYLINHESYHIIEDKIKKIVKNNNYTVFNLNKSSLKELIEEANYFSFDTDLKYIVASNSDFFGNGKITDDESQMLLQYLKQPNPSTTIIFTTQNGIDSRKKIVKEIKETGKLDNTAKLDKRAINVLLNDYLKYFDYTADYNTINYIIDNCYGNIDIMFNELEKIMIYYGFPQKIKYEDVLKIVGQELDSNNFHFVNAVVDKNLKEALRILKNLKVYKVEPTSLVILLAREYRLMYYVKKLINKMSLNEIITYLKMPDWQVNKLYNNSIKYSSSELLKNLVFLSDIDLNIKKGKWDKDIALYGFLMEACS